MKKCLFYEVYVHVYNKTLNVKYFLQMWCSELETSTDADTDLDLELDAKPIIDQEGNKVCNGIVTTKAGK